MKQILIIDGDKVVNAIGAYINNDKVYEITIKEIGDIPRTKEDIKVIIDQINQEIKERK